MKRLLAASFLLSCFLSSPHAAAQARLTESDAAGFAKQRAAVERDLADGQAYAEISAEAKQDVMRSLARMQGLFDDAGPAGVLSPAGRSELLSDQARVNALLATAAEDSRLVCRRERRTGSNFVTSSCQTLAEQRRQREAALKALSTGNGTPASGP